MAIAEPVTSMIRPRRKIVALVPAHNEADCIEATIEALLGQDRPLDKIVVICDNCTDDTQERASRYDVTVVVPKNNKHRKPGALNWAWREFCQEADILVTLDADTVLPYNAVRDWEREFSENPDLGGSSSKFTMRGDKMLVRLQRSEFSRWTDTGLRRGETTVLAGTGCSMRNSVMKQIASRDDREGPWVYTSEVEDFELTYRIRESGFRCQVSPTVRAYTDAMDTMKSLWAQRMKWQVGTVSDLLGFGFNKLTRIDWLQQFAGLLAALVRGSWIGMTIAALVLGTYNFVPLWLLPTLVFIANDTRQALRIPHRDKKDILMAAILLPQEFFAWMRAGWFFSAWIEVLINKVTGRQKNRWDLQIEAEKR